MLGEMSMLKAIEGDCRRGEIERAIDRAAISYTSSRRGRALSSTKNCGRPLKSVSVV